MPATIHRSRLREAGPPAALPHSARWQMAHEGHAVSSLLGGWEAPGVGKLHLAFSSGTAGKNGGSSYSPNSQDTEPSSALKIGIWAWLHIFKPCYWSFTHFTFVLGHSRVRLLSFIFWREMVVKRNIKATKQSTPKITAQHFTKDSSSVSEDKALL